MTTEVAKRKAAAVAVPAETVRAELDRMLSRYEGTDTGDGADRVALAILSADTVDALNEPWDTVKWRETLVGQHLRIESIRPMPSDFTEGYGFYLFVEGVNLTTGEPIAAGIGSAMIMMQLLKADDSGWLPLRCEILRQENRKNPAHPWYRLQVLGSDAIEG